MAATGMYVVVVLVCTSHLYYIHVMYLCVVRTSGRYASYVVHSKCGCEHTINRTHTIQHTVHAYQHIIYVVCTVQVLKFHITHSSYITTTSRGVHPGVCVPHTCVPHTHMYTVEDMYKKELIIFISYHCALVHLLVNVVSYSTGCVPKRNIEHQTV